MFRHLYGLILPELFRLPLTNRAADPAAVSAPSGTRGIDSRLTLGLGMIGFAGIADPPDAPARKWIQKELALVGERELKLRCL
jgi:hypothetical protein